MERYNNQSDVFFRWLEAMNDAIARHQMIRSLERLYPNITKSEKTVVNKAWTNIFKR